MKTHLLDDQIKNELLGLNGAIAKYTILCKLNDQVIIKPIRFYTYSFDDEGTCFKMIRKRFLMFSGGHFEPLTEIIAWLDDAYWDDEYVTIRPDVGAGYYNNHKMLSFANGLVNNNMLSLHQVNARHNKGPIYRCGLPDNDDNDGEEILDRLKNYVVTDKTVFEDNL